MPFRAPHVCMCGNIVAHGSRCPCHQVRDRERKARFDATRPSARERGYDTKWDRERQAFLAAHPTCVRCAAPSRIVDHIMPHKGDQKLFWRRSNWQALCVACHSVTKQSEERRR